MTKKEKRLWKLCYCDELSCWVKATITWRKFYYGLSITPIDTPASIGDKGEQGAVATEGPHTPQDHQLPLFLESNE